MEEEEREGFFALHVKSVGRCDNNNKADTRVQERQVPRSQPSMVVVSYYFIVVFVQGAIASKKPTHNKHEQQAIGALCGLRKELCARRVHYHSNKTTLTTMENVDESENARATVNALGKAITTYKKTNIYGMLHDL